MAATEMLPQQEQVQGAQRPAVKMMKVARHLAWFDTQVFEAQIAVIVVRLNNFLNYYFKLIVAQHFTNQFPH